MSVLAVRDERETQGVSEVVEEQGARQGEQQAEQKGSAGAESTVTIPTALSEAEVRERLERLTLDERMGLIVELLYLYRAMRFEHLMKLVYSKYLVEAQGIAESTARRYAHEDLAWMKQQELVEHIRPKGLRKSNQVVYVLGRLGRALVKQSRGLRKDMPDLAARLHTPADTLVHDLRLVETMMSIQLDVESLGGVMEWYGEYELMAVLDERGRNVRWDALGKISLVGLTIHFAVEIDTGSESVTGRFYKKVSNYAAYYHGSSTNWKLLTQQQQRSSADFPEVLVVTQSDILHGEIRLRGMRQVAQEKMKAERLTGKLRWHITSFERLARVESSYLNPAAAPVWGSSPEQDHYPVLRYDALLQAGTMKLKEIVGKSKALLAEGKEPGQGLRDELAMIQNQVKLLHARVGSLQPKREGE